MLSIDCIIIVASSKIRVSKEIHSMETVLHEQRVHGTNNIRRHCLVIFRIDDKVHVHSFVHDPHTISISEAFASELLDKLEEIFSRY